MPGHCLGLPSAWPSERIAACIEGGLEALRTASSDFEALRGVPPDTAPPRERWPPDTLDEKAVARPHAPLRSDPMAGEGRPHAPLDVPDVAASSAAWSAAWSAGGGGGGPQ